MANKRICDSCGAKAAPEDQECAVCEGIIIDTEPLPKKEKKEKKPKK